jgi:hypothetical protein
MGHSSPEDVSVDAMLGAVYGSLIRQCKQCSGVQNLCGVVASEDVMQCSDGSKLIYIGAQGYHRTRLTRHMHNTNTHRALFLQL